MSSIPESAINECRLIQLRLLDVLKRICEAHGLTYWIDFGTLLGAVRHKGFIPWDDDIDVSMPIDDYKKFLQIAKEELPKDIFLQTRETDSTYTQHIAKLRDCYSTYLENHEDDDYNKVHPYHKGIYIDIFPSVSYPPLPKKVRKFLTVYTMRAASNFLVKNNTFINTLVYRFLKLIWLFLRPFHASLIGVAPEDNGWNFAIDRKFIYPLQQIEFEGRYYAAPRDTDIHLTNMYGDYMTPLPPKERTTHARTILPTTPCEHPRALEKK